MGILKKSTSKKSKVTTETKIIPDEKDGMMPFVEETLEQDMIEEDVADPAAASEEEGQLALDVFQTPDEIVVVAPIAGVAMKDLNISIARDPEFKDEVLVIKGSRNFHFKVAANDYTTQECFWGNFSRRIILPESVDTSRIEASFNHGVLTVRIPKIERMMTRTIKIKSE